MDRKELQPLKRTEPSDMSERILQFGGGNFLRAFTDWMIDIFNKETDFSGSVVIVKPTERGDYQQIDDQDGLFHVVLDGIIDGEQQSKVHLVESVSRTIHPYRDWEGYLASAHIETMRFVISNTTEAGIVFSDKDEKKDQAPDEFPGKLTLWLYERFRHFDGAADKGCLIFPCELIEDNGSKLRETILQYIAHWNLGDEFKSWILDHNYFYDTLVDRIVSGYPEDRAAEIEAKTGYKDPLMVAGEFYHSWIMSGDERVREELPFESTSLNIRCVESLKEYRELKVRVLNGAHTSLVPVGYLAGKRTVDEAMSDSSIRSFVEGFLREEVKPVLDFIPESEVDEFISDVVDRFLNPVLAHQLLDISLNSIAKFGTRLLPTLKDYVEKKNNLPDRLLYSLACLILFYKGNWKGENIPLRDDAANLEFAAKTWKAHDTGGISTEELVVQWLDRLGVTDFDSSTRQEIADQVGSYISIISKDGIQPV